MRLTCICGKDYFVDSNTDLNVKCECGKSKYEMNFPTTPWTFKQGIPLTESQQPKSLPGAPNESYIPVVPVREKILQDALKIVTQDRNKDYGDPEDNFGVIAEYWTTYLHSRHLIPKSESLTATDVAAMMILMKCSRLATSPDKEDHWVDIAGYAACGGQCACKR